MAGNAAESDLDGKAEVQPMPRTCGVAVQARWNRLETRRERIMKENCYAPTALRFSLLCIGCFISLLALGCGSPARAEDAAASPGVTMNDAEEHFRAEAEKMYGEMYGQWKPGDAVVIRTIRGTVSSGRLVRILPTGIQLGPRFISRTDLTEETAAHCYPEVRDALVNLDVSKQMGILSYADQRASQPQVTNEGPTTKVVIPTTIDNRPLIYTVHQNGKEEWVTPVAWNANRGQYIPQAVDIRSNALVSCVKDSDGRYVLPNDNCALRPSKGKAERQRLGDSFVGLLFSLLPSLFH